MRISARVSVKVRVGARVRVKVWVSVGVRVKVRFRDKVRAEFRSKVAWFLALKEIRLDSYLFSDPTLALILKIILTLP